MNLKIAVFICLVLGCFSSCFAQVKEGKKDSSLYKNIETYSKKRKATKFLHKLIFKSTTPKPNYQTTQKPAQDVSMYEGKIIRQIHIETHDPFGFSFKDSTETANSWLEKTGNTLHIKSKEGTIRNFLLMEEGRPLDSLQLEESARLLRTQRSIRSVEVIVRPIPNTTDSVDVFVTVLDSWSLIPSLTLSSNTNALRLRERNVLGLGHEFNNQFTNRLSDGKNAYDLRYTVPNFKNTFINTSIGYNRDLNGFYGKFLDMSRPFYSPLTKWAGGLYFDEQFRQEPSVMADTLNSDQNFNYQSADVWGGYSFRIFEGPTEKERTSNLIIAARLLRLDYKQRPTLAFDSIGYFSSETFVLGSVGIASRQFVQDAFIFQDGIVEDVPIGTVYAVTFGNQRKFQTDRLYLGARISHGRYFDWGYLSSNFEYGTFVNQQQLEQTAYAFQFNYFTNLIPLGAKWHMRQFVKPQLVIGTNRLNSVGDRLTIDERNPFEGVYGNQVQRDNHAGIPGFDSDLMGTQKFVLSLQTQFYAPWEVLGFRLNPFVNVSAALLGTEGIRITKNRLYAAFGVGVSIRNDFLVFNTFQFSLSYYPSIPGNGEHVFQTNSFETQDFGFQSFQLGKPTPIWYN